MILPSRKKCEEALRRNNGTKADAAKSLNIDRQQFYRILNHGYSPGLNKALEDNDVEISRNSTWRLVTDKVKASDVIPEELTLVEEHKLKTKVRQLETQVKELLTDNVSNQIFVDFTTRVIEGNKVENPGWLLKNVEKDKKTSPAIVTAVLSDIHYGEVINGSEIEFCNAYDTFIAAERLEKFFSNIVTLTKDYLSGLDIEGLVLLLGGDFLSGSIHDELKETNEISDYQAVLELSSLLADGILFLENHFKNIHVKAVPGNHARNSKKPRMKKRAINDLDWLTYQLTSKYVKDALPTGFEDNVTFHITEGSDISFSIYDTRFVLTHGDQFNGGSGISGMLSPLMLGDHRKRKRQQSLGNPYDWLIMGHWHQLMLGAQGIIVNGSVVGYNEYAYNKNLPVEVPQQAFWVTDPEHGVTLRAPIHL